MQGWIIFTLFEKRSFLFKNAKEKTKNETVGFKNARYLKKYVASLTSVQRDLVVHSTGWGRGPCCTLYREGEGTLFTLYSVQGWRGTLFTLYRDGRGPCLLCTGRGRGPCCWRNTVLQMPNAQML